jgi:hypothetical protein
VAIDEVEARPALAAGRVAPKDDAATERILISSAND